MQVKKTVEKLQESSIFKEWKEQKTESYLTHLFRMMDEPEQGTWHLGYFDPGEEKITTFIMEEEIKKAPAEEVFREPNTELNPLDISDVEIDWMEALEKASEFQSNNYSKEVPIKSFFILQNLPKGTVYNLTFVTKAFNTLNIKISASSGEVVEHKLSSLFDMAKMEKGLRNETQD